MFKKYIKYSIIFTAILSSVSCKKFLDVEPRESISDAATIVDNATAETALNGTYNALGSTDYYGIAFNTIGYAGGDNVVYIGTLVYNSQFTTHTVRSDNQTILSAWRAIYNTINRANHIIYKLPLLSNNVITDAQRNSILGQAYFIRGLAYFDIARLWGGAQIVLEPTFSITDKNGIKRSTADQTYAQSLSDLKQAESLLSETTNRVRATKKTTWALLSRFYLYQKDYTNAELYAAKLVGDNNYELVKPYSAWFANNATQTKESVFEIAYSTAFLNTNRNDWQPASSGGGRRIIPTDQYISLITNTAIGGNRGNIVAKTSTGLWYGNLYYRSPATDPSYIIRIAEVHLNLAEAAAQLGKTDLALKHLNFVRSRADLAAVTTSEKSGLLLAIENERRLEFGLEPHRWFDLVRTGRAKDVLGVTDPQRYLMPIPLEETIIDDDLDQNPGYN